jgi:phosphodiesterase/alkaline phosphatase D-like protein
LKAFSAPGTYTPIAYVNASTVSYTDTGLNSSMIYFYKVEAQNDAGKGPLSVFDFAKTFPGTPTNVTATAQSPNSIKVTWNAPSGGKPIQYNILRAPSASGTYAQIAYVSGSTVSYTNTGLNSSTSYYYKIEAENSSTEKSLPSSAVSATTPSSGSGASSGSIKIVNNSSYTIGNITLYQYGYDLSTLSGMVALSNNDIYAGETITVGNIPTGSYTEMGSNKVAGYSMRRYTDFTITAGQTTTVTITNLDFINN